jgi:hypothetical protein
MKKDKIDEQNINTQASTSTDFTKKNKMLFYKTISSNFSGEQYKNQNNRSPQRSKIAFSLKKRQLKNNIKFPQKVLQKNASTSNNKARKSIVSLPDFQKKETEKNGKEVPFKINSLLPTNINSYLHLIRGSSFGIYDNLNWALRLRDYSFKGLNNTRVIDYKDYYYRENLETNFIKSEKIKLTDNFNPPSYYETDLNKYKKRMQPEKRPLITQMNPNYDKIRHLLFGNNQGKVNYSQFLFETTLRNIKGAKSAGNRKWEILPVPKTNKKIIKFLSPVTEKGKLNLKNIEKYLSKNYQFSLQKTTYGGDSIIKRNIFNNKNYTISGMGETLGDEKYDNIFGDNNMFANKRILSTHTNQQCKFELGLRLYGKDKKYSTQTNFRKPKKKKI